MHTDTATENDVVVSLTESAAQQVKALLAGEQENAGKTLRVVFDEKRDDDFSAQFYGVSVLVDPFSADYLRGSIVDFKDELNGGGFKITNPRARQSCGCGKSFEA